VFFYLTLCCCAAGINNRTGLQKRIAERIWQLVQIFLTGVSLYQKSSIQLFFQSDRNNNTFFEISKINAEETKKAGDLIITCLFLSDHF